MTNQAKMRVERMAAVATAAMMLTAGVIAATAAPAQATFPGKNGKIVFESDMISEESPEGDIEIYTIDPDGSGLKQLTKNDGHDASPAWSSDGKRITFQSNRDSDGGAADVFVMNADGSDQENLTNSPDVDDESPAWSPNGKQIAFHTLPGDGAFDVVVMNADGSNPKNLTSRSDAFNGFPAWSPDGKRIAFQSNRDSVGGGDDIFVMNADGSKPKNLTDSDDGIDFAPDWSPDGKRITFSSDQDSDGGIFDVYSIRADGSGLPDNLTETPDADEFFSAYAPNGKRIAFDSNRDGVDSDIFVMKPDGSDPRNITDSLADNDRPTDWQPRKK